MENIKGRMPQNENEVLLDSDIVRIPINSHITIDGNEYTVVGHTINNNVKINFSEEDKFNDQSIENLKLFRALRKDDKELSYEVFFNLKNATSKNINRKV